ncbi:MAG: class I SAM-dependent methyltransferase [Vicinamibacteria bacterium]
MSIRRPFAALGLLALASAPSACSSEAPPAAAQHATARPEPADPQARPADPEAFIAMLEDPARDAYQRPDEVVAALALRPGDVVADIGSGSGYFALRLARAVGEQGRVYAVDIDPDLIKHLNRRIRDAGLRNLHTVLVPPDDPLLPDASIDLFFICDTWHHIPEQPRYLAGLKRMLKPGGRVAMVDFHKRALPVGPPLSLKISREELIAQMRRNGFVLAKEHGLLAYQYFLEFVPAKPSR